MRYVVFFLKSMLGIYFGILSVSVFGGVVLALWNPLPISLVLTQFGSIMFICLILSVLGALIWTVLFGEQFDSSEYNGDGADANDCTKVSDSEINRNSNDSADSHKVNVSADQWRSELNALIGLGSIKNEISRLSAFMKNQKERSAKGLKTTSPALHMVFLGNPGTGKTTVARIIGSMYKDLGLLSKGHIIETDRSGLVGAYIGQTAIKTKEIIEQAIGGVLFIDEAYTLAQDNEQNFGHEAIGVLLKYMEDYRSDIAVVVAGYDAEMSKFIDSNPGLQSRLRRVLNFPDYSSNELMEIFATYCKTNGYKPTSAARSALEQYFVKVLQNPPKNFANARHVRNLFEEMLEQQAMRIQNKSLKAKSDFQSVEAEDLPDYVTGVLG